MGKMTKWEKQETVFVESEEVALERVRRGDYAFIWYALCGLLWYTDKERQTHAWTTWLLLIALNTSFRSASTNKYLVSRKENCDLTTIGDSFAKRSYGIGVRAGAKYRCGKPMSMIEVNFYFYWFLLVFDSVYWCFIRNYGNHYFCFWTADPQWEFSFVPLGVQAPGPQGPQAPLTKTARQKIPFLSTDHPNHPSRPIPDTQRLSPPRRPLPSTD